MRLPREGGSCASGCFRMFLRADGVTSARRDLTGRVQTGRLPWTGLWCASRIRTSRQGSRGSRPMPFKNASKFTRRRINQVRPAPTAARTDDRLADYLPDTEEAAAPVREEDPIVGWCRVCDHRRYRRCRRPTSSSGSPYPPAFLIDSRPSSATDGRIRIMLLFVLLCTSRQVGESGASGCPQLSFYLSANTAS